MPRSFHTKGYSCLLSISITLSSMLSGSANDDESQVAAGQKEIGLSELIALGLKNDPQLIALRGEITIATARKKAARDWPDPQIRFRKSWGYNEIPAPYTQHRTEKYNQQVTRSETDELGIITNSTINESIARNSQRTITEGKDKTIIDETIDESSSEITATAPTPLTGDPGGITSETRNLQRSGRETRYHETDPFASEEDLVAQFRLYVPHPGIRRARLKRAQHEIQLVRAELVSEERSVVQRIREEYQGLQYLKARIGLQEKNDEAAKIYSDVQDKLLTSGLTTIDKIEYVEIDNLASDGIAIDYEAARDRLAARVGLQNFSTIRITDKLISPAVDLDHSHLEYLIRMALTNRGELTTHSEKGEIAQAQLNEAKARNRPWFNYFQAEFGRDEQGGTKSGTNWGIQFAMSLPVFSWLGNERKVHEAAVKSHYSQMGAIQKIVTAEIAAAYQNVKRCADYRSKAREHALERKERNAEFFEKIGGMDRRKLEETRYDVTRGTLNADRHRLDAEHAYNLSLLQLEQALGTSLSRVFSEQDTSHAEPTSASAAKAEPAAKASATAPASNAGKRTAVDKEAPKPTRSTVRSKVRALLDRISLPGNAGQAKQP
ncbi:MAG: TolC family protein [Verrucomicrobiaceae bacterium]|nr:TolC family protein [Verrucomicrobiaceae bacterium]